MANRTDSQAETVHGTNPQYLVDRIIRNKIYNDAYWKEFCFGLTTESLIDRASEIDYVAGTFGGRRRPAKFLCLFLKMLQIQPDEEVILEYIKQSELKYLRALGAAYYRISQRHVDVYKTLEPLYADYRKLRYRDMNGKLSIIHMDEFIDMLFREKTVCDVTMPGLPKREVLELTVDLPLYESVLEDDLEDLEDLEPQPETEGAAEPGEGAGEARGHGRSRFPRRPERSAERSGERSEERSEERSGERSGGARDRPRGGGPARAPRAAAEAPRQSGRRSRGRPRRRSRRRSATRGRRGGRSRRPTSRRRGRRRRRKIKRTKKTGRRSGTSRNGRSRKRKRTRTACQWTSGTRSARAWASSH